MSQSIIRHLITLCLSIVKHCSVLILSVNVLNNPKDGDVFCSVCLTVEGISYPTGTLLVQHINVVFLSPLGPSWASKCFCV